MMHFPCFRFPPYFKNFFRLSEIFLQFYLFPKDFFTFIRQISDDFFLVIGHKFQISPLFHENYSFPSYFYEFSHLCFRQIHLLFTYFTCISSPTLTMMHLCITQCTYWTPLRKITRFTDSLSALRTSASG